MSNPSTSRPAVRFDSPQIAERSLGRLSACSGIDGAAWLRVAPHGFEGRVGSIVPPVFESYARVFHPASRSIEDGEEAVSWAEVARANGRDMHPAAEWGSITGSWAYQYRSIQPDLWDRAPATGDLPHEVAQRLVALLSAHTGDPSHGFFGVWEGWGEPKAMFFFPENTPEGAERQAQEAFDAAVIAWHRLIDAAAAFAVPHRRMHLLSGPLVAIDDFHELYDDPPSLCLRHRPSLWWPADEAWCVGTDIDLMTTYVGGSAAAIESLVGDCQLEVLKVPVDQRVTWDADTVNPLPAPP